MTEVLILAVLIILCAFFSFSETALTAVSRVKVRKLLNQGVFNAKALFELRENPAKMLSTILVGNTIVNICAASLATTVVIRFFEGNHITNISLAVAAATVIMTLLILVFGEITPKTVAMRSADRVALFVAPAINFIALLLSPVIFAINYLCRPLIKIFGGDASAKVPFVTEEELKLLLSVGEEEGVLEQEEKEMIHSIFEFSDTIVKEVMTPRPDMFCLEVCTPLNEAIQKISEDAHSRVPVYEGTIDNIIGLVFAKDLLGLLADGSKDQTLRQILRPPLFAPETKKLDDLLRQMQATRMHIAVIVDEYGGTAGIVSLEDLIEEIVGEIKDEFDIEEKTMDVLSDGATLLDARLSVSEANEKLGTSIPEGDYDTIGGFVLSLLGKLPSIGDTVRFDEYRISIEKVVKKRITRIKIEKISDPGTGIKANGR